MMEFIKNQSYSSQDVLRLFLLYVLRYETDGKIGDVQEAMIQNRRLSRDESEVACYLQSSLYLPVTQKNVEICRLSCSWN